MPDDGDPGPPPSLGRRSTAPLLPVGGGDGDDGLRREPAVPAGVEAPRPASPPQAASTGVGTGAAAAPLADPYAGAAAPTAAPTAAAGAAPSAAAPLPDPYAGAAEVGPAPPPAPAAPAPIHTAASAASLPPSEEARRAAAVANLERLRDVAKTFENAHDDFYEGLAGIGALLGIGIFLAAWLTGLTGLGSLVQTKENPTFQLVITVAGLVGGALSTVQRVWGPAVRATHYRAARDAYAKLRKRAKAALASDSVAALDSAVKAVEAKLDDLYDSAPDVPVDRDGYAARGGRFLYGALLGFGAFFYPCAVCCAPGDPPKPTDRRRGGEDGV